MTQERSPSEHAQRQDMVGATEHEHPVQHLSIVVINHNYAAYLRQAILSALAQTYRPLEVIVVDDGSTDDSASIINSFGTAITPIFQPQAGHVTAFNTGFAASMGDILIFLDADDVLYPDCAKKILDAWSPEVAKIQYRLDTIDEKDIDQCMPFPYFPPDLGPKEILQQSLTRGVYPWTVSSGNAFGRQLLVQLLPISAEQIFKSPDGYVNKMAPLFGDVKSLNTPLGAYRVHGKNAWAQSSQEINPSSWARWVRFDALLHNEFAQRAGRAGYTVKPYDLLANPQMLEQRILSLRFAPGEHPFPEDRRAALSMRAVQSAFAAQNTSYVGKITWAIWLLFICLAPLRGVSIIFRSGRSQSGRKTLAKFLVRMSRGPATRSH